MPKILITATCIVNRGDDLGGVAEEFGSVVAAPKDVCKSLVSSGRALYVDKKDDADKSGRYTASEAMLVAARKTQKQRPDAGAGNPANGDGKKPEA